MSRHTLQPTVTTGLAEHPSVQAWRQFAPEAAVPSALTPLKPQLKPSHKSGVYRLHAVTADAGNVVAKRCSAATAQTEHVIYDQILPRLGLPTLRCYGCFHEADGAHCWLFLEDAGDTPYTEDQSEWVAEWLARVHSSAAVAAAGTPLRDRGPAHYRSHLHRGIELISRAMGTVAYAPGDRRMLQGVLQLCARLDSAWKRVEDLCRQMPETLVHGDFATKNVRTRLRDGTLCLFALDWETAGWGPPMPDLAHWSGCLGVGARADLDRYLATVRPYWPHLRPKTLELCADTGALLRLVSSIYWAACGIAYEWNTKPMGQLRLYETRLGNLMQVLGCR